MSMYAPDVREMVTDVLKAVDAHTEPRVQLYSLDAVELLLLTCAQESFFARHLRQIKGPAVGIFQMEPGSHDDIWKNVLGYNKSLRDVIQTRFMLGGTTDFNLRCNLAYATIMARLQYWRQREKLPSWEDILGMARYYKRYFNSLKGKATVEEAIKNYQRYVLGAA